MDNKLTTMIWSSYLGGSGDDAAYSVALDRNDNAYVAGGTNSPDFAKSINAIDTSYTGVRADGFVTKINTTGSAIINSTYYGSDLYDQIYFIELDRKDSVYVFGQTDKMDSSFIKNATYFTYNSGQFVSKLSPNLDTVEWSTVFGSGGGGPNISPTAFLVDVCNKIYLSGWGGTTNSIAGLSNNSILTTGMDTTAGAFQTTTDGSDFYLMVLESDASNIFYGSYFGGPISAEHVDGGTSRFDRNGRIFQSVCAGCGFNSDFPIKPIPGAVSATNGSSCNNGVFKFDFNLPITLADFDVNQVSCLNDTSFFRNKSLNGTSFHWDFGDGNFSTLYSPYHVYTTTGNFIVTLTVSDTTACNYSDTIRKMITILSDSLWYLPNDTICDSSFKQIGFLPSTNPSISYLWSPSIGLSDTTISNPIASPFNTTTYRLLISNGVCTDTVFTTVVVTKLRLRIPSDTTLCIPGTAINIPANSFGTTSYFHWSSNPIFSDMLNSNFRDSILTVSPLVSTTYYLRIGNNGCYKEDTIRVHIFTSQLSIVGPSTICLGDTISLIVRNLGGDTLTYDWMPNMEIISGDFTRSILTAPNATTSYSVITTNSNGCQITLNKSIYVSPLPILSVTATADKTTIFSGETVQLSSTPSGFTYSWSPVTGLSNSTIQNPIANPTSTTTYTVTVSDSGCVRSSDVKITVIDVICGPPDLYVPNAFTPNGDGDNDVLFVRGNNITSMTLRIYHRWGEKVFESTKQTEGWDGKFKGKECDPAVFVYYLDVTCLGGETYQGKGNVTLIR
ncbi:gliding motility-associated C-terminal domain-containing protein, partial [Flavobacteriales bacterium]|nr:gliding motility-associated C-terminal domain-containing protein [Flavobacteriales bacterium]